MYALCGYCYFGKMEGAIISNGATLKMQIFSQLCYYIRNRYLADHADVVLAVYDMNANKGSGTGYTVHYAQAQGKAIIVIDPGNFHVSCSSTKTQNIF